MKVHDPERFVITIVGAESSGKTTLAVYLAGQLGCDWLPEYSREYLSLLNRPYEFDDLESIARGTAKLLSEITEKNSWNTRENKSSSAVTNSAWMNEVNTQEDFIQKLKGLQQHILIVDGGMLTIRMWAKIKYGKEIPFVEAEMQKDPTSLYLLCRPGKSWEEDPLREAPDLIDRVWIFNQYLHQLLIMKIPFLFMKGVW